MILGRHDLVGGSTNWSPQMDRYVGRQATVVSLLGSDPSGCLVARVDVDGGSGVWRLRNMTRFADDQAVS